MVMSTKDKEGSYGTELRTDCDLGDSYYCPKRKWGARRRCNWRASVGEMRREQLRRLGRRRWGAKISDCWGGLVIEGR